MADKSVPNLNRFHASFVWLIEDSREKFDKNNLGIGQFILLVQQTF